MRDILFRGKRKDNGEWVYGWYAPISVSDTHGPQMVIVTTEPNDYMYMGYGARLASPKFYSVDPDTIGQYTGLVDKNGVKIFEDDVVEHRTTYGEIMKYVVVWDQAYSRFAFVEWETGRYPHYFKAEREEVKYSCRVLGNPHDNPELTKMDIFRVKAK